MGKTIDIGRYITNSYEIEVKDNKGNKDKIILNDFAGKLNFEGVVKKIERSFQECQGETTVKPTKKKYSKRKKKSFARFTPSQIKVVEDNLKMYKHFQITKKNSQKAELIRQVAIKTGRTKHSIEMKFWKLARENKE